MKTSLMCVCCAVCALLGPIASADTYDDLVVGGKGGVIRLKRDSLKDASTRETLAESIAPKVSKNTYPDIPRTHSTTALGILKMKIRSTGTTRVARAAWGYNAQSMEKMSTLLTPEDVPALLELYATDNGMIDALRNALASQCRAGLDAVLLSMQNKTFHAQGARSVDKYTASEIVHKISVFDRCDAQTQQDATHALMSLRF